MWVTVPMMVKFAKEVQLATAESPIWVSEAWIARLAKELHSLKE